MGLSGTMWLVPNFLFHILLVCCLFLLFSGISSVAVLQLGGNETDRHALLDIKAKITQDPFRVLDSWNNSLHFCHWYGVTCSSRHQRVTKLDLHSKHMQGSISPRIGNLSFLKVLSLHHNNFSNEIPQEIGQLYRMQRLSLQNNSLGGEIPANICHCLELIYLGLAGNKLMGEIPAELGSLQKLQVLLLGSNYLTGKIPLSVGNLSSINTLSVLENYLEGSIPNTIGQLRHLYHLALGLNKLSGNIPASFYNLSSISVFYAPMNKLQGTLPRNFFFPLSNIKRLIIHTNQLSGLVPVSLANASTLEFIDIGKNNFTGKVPSLARLHSLRQVQFYDNGLGNGEDDDLDFISSLANCTSLEVLALHNNNLGGTLPNSLSNFSTNFRYLGFGRNQIHGRIPIGIGNLISLEGLGMETNQLSGSIPDGIGSLQNLVELYLYKNKLSGYIPSSLGNLTSLNKLSLANNNLEGTIPSSLGKCQFLIALLLAQNKLSGTIPKQVIGLSSLAIYLDLSKNQLIGVLPAEVSNLKNLGYLDVSENRLSGKIPASLGSCTSLVGLHLEGNLFQGTIPPSLSSLRGLEELDLSHNNLSGQIPVYLERFVFLQNLNLSFNDLDGVVPIQGAFKNASRVSIMGNRKLCGGIPELHLPLCKAEGADKYGLSLKMKLLIFLVTGILAIILVLVFLIFLVGKKRRNLAPKSSFSSSLLKLSYHELHKATNGFSSANLIGVGSFGKVYKGVLSQAEPVVAVKVLDLQHGGASKSFMVECEALRNIRHRNLIKIITACSSIDFQGNEFRALVFEFMTNGSLEEWLHPTPIVDGKHVTARNLSLMQRLTISIDVANALDYLHHGCHTPIIHCDLKPSNVLLDSDMTAHLSDFGLASVLLETPHLSSANQSSSLGIKGSIGYTAPEYGMGSEVSTYGDVYSYGILLLEMFSGKGPTESMFNESLNLHNFIKMALPDRVLAVTDSKLLEIEDTSINGAHNKSQFRGHIIQECLTAVMKIGVVCSAESPRERMDISDVANELRLIKDLFFWKSTSEEC